MENKVKKEIVFKKQEIEYAQVLVPEKKRDRNHVFYDLDRLQEMGKEGWEIVCKLNVSFDGIVFLLKKSLTI